jgi:hypothetical protein
MKIKTPFGGAIEFDPTLCSKTMPDDENVLKSGYVATCPKTDQQFEVQVVITQVGTDQEEAKIGAAPLPQAAVLAKARDAHADKVHAGVVESAQKAAGEAVEKIEAVAVAAGVPITEQLRTRLFRTAHRAKVAEVVEAEMEMFDKSVTVEQAKAAVANKKAADEALARAGG